MERINVGNLKLTILSDGFFKLDGGAMFGLIPKPLWNRTNPADENNRIKLALRSLLIEIEGKNILVNTGIGNKLERDPFLCVDHGKTDLMIELKEIGLNPEDIDTVILTHLHLDHAGWNTVSEGGKIIPTFPKAEYIVQKGEWTAATEPDELSRGSYKSEDFVPLKEHGQLTLIEGDQEITAGIKVQVTGGHTKYHQIVLIENNNEVAVFWSDILPTTTHLKLPYIMGYDLYPLDSLKVKKKLTAQAAREGWLCIWEHDPEISNGYLTMEADKVKVKTVDCRT
jgi:glyoxylase-like metal-dependent hydrolase (beta-lactamase superfamily II)